MDVCRLDHCQLPFEFFFSRFTLELSVNISEIFKLHHTYTRIYRRFSFDFELSCTDVIFQEYIMMHSTFPREIANYRQLSKDSFHSA